MTRVGVKNTLRFADLPRLVLLTCSALSWYLGCTTLGGLRLELLVLLGVGYVYGEDDAGDGPRRGGEAGGELAS